MLRGYGCGVHHRVQDPNDASLSALIRHEMEESIRQYLPEVQLTAPIRLNAEGEILTIAVARSHRRLGLGWKLLDAVLRELHRERAGALFLEVDETNVGAIALYRRLGFSQVGRRPGYYPAQGKPASGALVMRRDLR